MRRLFAPLLLAPAALAAAGTFSPVANAAAQRTFVASYGSPSNIAFNCSLIKPCRAFSEAIGVTNPKGEVIVLDSAGYGAATITQAVSIIAPPGIYAGVSVLTGDGITVAAGAGDVVTLSGLTINGEGGNNGVVVNSATHVHLERFTIRNMAQFGIWGFANSRIYVRDSLLSNNAVAGLLVDALSYAQLDDSRFVNNGTGISVSEGTLNANRIVVEDNDRAGVQAIQFANPSFVTLTDSVVSGNGSSLGDPGVKLGIDDPLDAASSELRIIRTTIAKNGGAGCEINGQHGFRTFLLSDSTVTDSKNGSGVQLLGPSTIRATIAGSTISHNFVDGVSVNGVLSTAIVSNSTITYNSNAGVRVGNDGIAIVSGSALASNIQADLFQENTGVLRSSGNNALTGRGAPDISGTISANPLK
jgi:hypothetical protein